MTDPKETVCLARELKIETYAAIGLVTAWEGLVLAVGHPKTGRVKGYTADHLAGTLGWKRPTRQLIAALKHAGLLKQERGGFLHPYWKDSTTGVYATFAEERRAYERDRKRVYRTGESPDSENPVPGTSANVPGTSRGQIRDSGHRSIEGRPGDTPPDPPREGGAGFARWEILSQIRPLWCVDSKACVKVLDEMTPGHWEMVEWFVRVALQPGNPAGLSISRKVLSGAKNSRLFMTRGNYARALPIWEAELARRAEAQKPKKKEDADALDKTEQARKFASECLADPHSTEQQKEKARRTLETLGPAPVAPVVVEVPLFDRPQRPDPEDLRRAWLDLPASSGREFPGYDEALREVMDTRKGAN